LSCVLNSSSGGGGDVSSSRSKRSSRIKTANRAFEYVAKFTCLGTTITYQNCIHKENKSIEFGECLLLSFSESFVCRLVSSNVKVKIYKTIIVLFFVWV
jgi:hypothetical protein